MPPLRGGCVGEIFKIGGLNEPKTEIQLAKFPSQNVRSDSTSRLPLFASEFGVGLVTRKCKLKYCWGSKVRLDDDFKNLAASVVVLVFSLDGIAFRNESKIPYSEWMRIWTGQAQDPWLSQQTEYSAKENNGGQSGHCKMLQ